MPLSRGPVPLMLGRMGTTGKFPPGPKGHPLIGNALQILRAPFDFPLRCMRDYGDVVRLRFGSLNLYQWYNDVRNGNQNALRTVRIQLQNEDHTAVVLTWKLLRARPVRLKWGPLNGKGKEVLVEYLELACERLEME